MGIDIDVDRDIDLDMFAKGLCGAVGGICSDLQGPAVSWLWGI